MKIKMSLYNPNKKAVIIIKYCDLAIVVVVITRGTFEGKKLFFAITIKGPY